jgi:hypothetical protein
LSPQPSPFGFHLLEAGCGREATRYEPAGISSDISDTARKPRYYWSLQAFAKNIPHFGNSFLLPHTGYADTLSE